MICVLKGHHYCKDCGYARAVALYQCYLESGVLVYKAIVENWAL
jgi:hypothetical protein